MALTGACKNSDVYVHISYQYLRICLFIRYIYIFDHFFVHVCISIILQAFSPKPIAQKTLG